MKLLPLIAAAVLAAPAAYAQAKPDRETALAEANSLIAGANAAAIFKPGAWAYGPTVLHERSGMLCLFAMGVPNTLRVNDPEPTRGDDVTCSTVVGGAIVSHFASRTTLVGSFESVSAGAVQAFMARVGSAKPYTGETFDLPAANLPPMRIQRSVSEHEGHELYQRIAVMDMGEWIITQRVTAPLAAGPSVDRLAAMNLAAIAKEMREKK